MSYQVRLRLAVPEEGQGCTSGQEEEPMKRYKKDWSGNTRKKPISTIEEVWESMVLVSVAICGGITLVVVLIIMVDLIKMGLHKIIG